MKSSIEFVKQKKRIFKKRFFMTKSQQAFRNNRAYPKTNNRVEKKVMNKCNVPTIPPSHINNKFIINSKKLNHSFPEKCRPVNIKCSSLLSLSYN